MGHSAGSTMSIWLPAIAALTDDQYCEALRVDFAVSYGRTVAGVHYQQDNLAGLNIGQWMIREQLPDFLSTKYGYDAGTIRSRRPIAPSTVSRSVSSARPLLLPR